MKKKIDADYNQQEIVYAQFFRPGCKTIYNCLKIMNASGPGQSLVKWSGGQCPPEAEAFSSQSKPKTQTRGTLSLNHVYHLYNTVITITFQAVPRFKQNGWAQIISLMRIIIIMFKIKGIEEQFTDYHHNFTLALM